MKDLTKASVEDTDLSIFDMMHNRDNWEFAAQLIAHGEIPWQEVTQIREKHKDFWALYFERPIGKAN